jgi:ribosomal protein L37AE/L43A
MSPFPRIARVPHTVKQPEACPHCGSHVLTRRGTRTKKLEIVQLWRCSSCKRVFTPGPEALRNKTYPLRMILSALSDYERRWTRATDAQARQHLPILAFRFAKLPPHAKLTVNCRIWKTIFSSRWLPNGEARYLIAARPCAAIGEVAFSKQSAEEIIKGAEQEFKTSSENSGSSG